MTKVKTKMNIRIIGILMAVVLFVNMLTATAHAAGPEILKTGTTYIGSFTFTDTNTTPIKTINGTKVTFQVYWRTADGGGDAPNVDQGIGNTKLTLQIIDANTNKALTSKKVFYPQDNDSWYQYAEISVNVTKGQKVKLWFDASSVGTSNGKYRSIYVRDYYAVVK